MAAFAIDITLAIAYLVGAVLGNPVDIVAKFIDLDRERSLPTWYASIQWFCVAALLWGFAMGHVSRSKPSSWLLLLLPAVFVLFSLDEIAQIHEGIGVLLDNLGLIGPRGLGPLAKTGVWFIVIGIPFVIAFGVLIAALWPYLRGSRRAFTKLVGGMALFMVGAIGVEALSNLVVAGSFLASLQVLVEETIEFVASTVVLWGSYELVRDTVGVPRLVPSTPE